VNLTYQAIQRDELSAALAAFLELTLKVAEDVVESETALAWWAHAVTRANEPLKLHRGVMLAGP